MKSSNLVASVSDERGMPASG